MKYIAYIAYPIMLTFVYCLFGLISWNTNPGEWPFEFRFLWIMWAVAWGYALSMKIEQGQS
jgi:hypothetical protein